MPGCVIKAILLSMVVASIAFFISHSQLLERFRDWIGKNEKGVFFYNLITCCYCLGHWIAIILLLFVPVKLFNDIPVFYGRGELILDFILTWLVVSWMAGIQSLAASQLWGE